MGFLLKTILSAGVFLLAEAGIKKLVSKQSDGSPDAQAYTNAVEALRAEGGADGADAKLIGAAMVYDKVESQGTSPDDFWEGISEEDRKLLEFSPEHARQQLKITQFGGVAGLVLFIAAAVAAGVGAKRGIPILKTTLAKLTVARAGGKKASELLTIIEEGKIEGLARVWTPAKWATFFGATGWLAPAMVNNLNDVGLWGRINLQNAEQDYNKVIAQRDRLSTSGGTGGFTSTPRQPVTRITMAKVAKPVVFAGVIFSQRIKHMDAFERNREDKITNTQELTTDAQNELNKWLATLPGRIGMSIQVQNTPYDENGFVQAGTWVTMTLVYTGISGRKVPLDTILLGQIDPVVYTPKTQDTLTIQQEIPKLLTAEEVAEVQFPSGGVKVVDKTGNIVPSIFGASAPASGFIDQDEAQGQTVAPVSPRLNVSPQMLNEIFRFTENDDLILHRSGDTLHSFDITKIFSNDEKAKIGNAGAQRSAAIPKIKERTGIDFTTLRKQSTFSVYPRGGPVGLPGEPRHIGYETIEAFLSASGGSVGGGKFPRTITVNVDALNVRAQASSSSALAGSKRLLRGDIFTAVDAVIGETVDGESRWWKSSFGNFVWVGGTAEKP